jgi:hypothetical protein
VRRSRSWRTIEVAGVRYRWRYGRGTIEVRRADNNQVVLRVDNYILRGTTPALFERGQHKRTTDGMVTPAMVRAAVARSVGAAPLKLKYRHSRGV